LIKRLSVQKKLDKEEIKIEHEKTSATRAIVVQAKMDNVIRSRQLM